jgi:hypothetical protein
MHSRQAYCLIAIACTIVLIVAPTLWSYRESHQQSLNHALISAIKRSDAPDVNSLLAAGADPNTRDTLVIHENLFQKLKHAES